MTVPEIALWQRLKHKQLAGLKFRRQHPYGPYIIDFYCHEVSLAIELDGRSHALPGAPAHDQRREHFLRNAGIRVIRFTNDQVLKDIDAVMRTVLCATKEGPPLPLPQGGDSEDASAHLTPERKPPGPALPTLSALVPNERGIERVIALNERAGFKIISKIAVFTAASETFSQRNTNASIAQTIERFGPVVDAAIEHDLDLRGYISCAVACPFEGPIAPAKVRQVADMLDQIGIDEIDLGDTIGAAHPADIAALLTDFTDYGCDLTLHLHDTFARAADCVRTALEMGVRSFDGSAAGLGGCPYASTPGKRAPGNIGTDLLVRTIHDAGFTTGVNLDALREASEYAARIVADARAGAAS